MKMFNPRQCLCVRAAWFLITLAGWLQFDQSESSGAVIYVDQKAAGSVTNGQSWATAFRSIRSGLAAASASDEIWVAAGTYYESIALPPNIALYGGFTGTETARTQRNWTRNETVLDGAQYILGDLFSIDYPELLPYMNPRSLVSILPGATPQTRLDGFTIRKGYSTFGAGVYVADGSPVIANNTIVSNIASGLPGGGGILFDVTRTLPEQSAIEFFTSTADRLLRSHYPFGITNIPVYPTNYYTPSVHQVLQLSANLYDATTSIPYPSVFRPLYFTNEMGAVFVAGYTNDNDAATINAWPTHETYGIPFVVGAKKGLPNFNEYVSQTHIVTARKLELQRLNTNTPIKLTMTNEMHILCISNLFALESWNSYTQAFGMDVTLQLRNDVIMSVTTNGSSNIFWTRGFTFTTTTNIPANTWLGFKEKLLADNRSFKLPLYTNAIALTNSIYCATPAPRFEPIGSNIFVATPEFAKMQWGLIISNRLTYMLSTTSDRKILDYVNLRNLNSEIDISGQLIGSQGSSYEPYAINNCWLTNRTTSGATEGIVNQINISLGSTYTEANDWHDYNYQLVDKMTGIDSFRAFFGLTPLYRTNNLENILLTNQAPFSPTRKMVVTTSWQVNDPLVHHLVEHLKDVTNNTTTLRVRPNMPIAVMLNLTNLNERYEPWGGNPMKVFHQSAMNPNIKDQGIWNSDDWDFPSSRQVNLHWLDRVHRGTPWQTVYLGVEAALETDWHRQFLDLDYGLPSHPTNDWHLLESYLANNFLDGATNSPLPVLVNNTIAGNQAAVQGGGIFVMPGIQASIGNNIITGNSSGIYCLGDGYPSSSWHNCVSGNSAYDYAGLPPGSSDVAKLPLFDLASGNLQLLPFSPCIDGSEDAVVGGWVERAGETAIHGAHIDIGAHEYNPGGKPFFNTAQRSQTNSAIQFTIKGIANQRYAVEASSNLVDWFPISTNTAATGQFLFQDSHMTNFPQRFYRTIEMP